MIIRRHLKQQAVKLLSWHFILGIYLCVQI